MNTDKKTYNWTNVSFCFYLAKRFLISSRFPNILQRLQLGVQVQGFFRFIGNLKEPGRTLSFPVLVLVNTDAKLNPATNVAFDSQACTSFISLTFEICFLVFTSALDRYGDWTPVWRQGEPTICLQSYIPLSDALPTNFSVLMGKPLKTVQNLPFLKIALSGKLISRTNAHSTILEWCWCEKWSPFLVSCIWSPNFFIPPPTPSPTPPPPPPPKPSLTPKLTLRLTPPPTPPLVTTSPHWLGHNHRHKQRHHHHRHHHSKKHWYLALFCVPF